MEFIEVSITADSEFCEILMAELAEIGFDSFLETDEGLDAYCTESLFQDLELKNILENYANKTAISYTIKGLKKENWNEEWEKNFSPIEVGNDIYIRANFHSKAPETFKHEIVITPKMSFGTGHHDTTAQVLELQLDIDHKQKSVLDVGTGTGILAIMAEQLGAVDIQAFDIDEWSVTNTIENAELNNCKNIVVRQGTIDQEPKNEYDIVLANINRNILLNEIPKYNSFMKSNSYLLVSGFYEQDVVDIQELAESIGLKKQKQLCKNNWTAIVFKKG
jgi:ribosomal protein L11 methyltransferase